MNLFSQQASIDPLYWADTKLAEMLVCIHSCSFIKNISTKKSIACLLNQDLSKNVDRIDIRKSQ